MPPSEEVEEDVKDTGRLPRVEGLDVKVEVGVDLLGGPRQRQIIGRRLGILIYMVSS